MKSEIVAGLALTTSLLPIHKEATGMEDSHD